MKRTLVAVLLLAAAGCKQTETASNTATEYVDTMQSNVEEAKEAADKANDAIAAAQEQAKAATSAD